MGIQGLLPLLKPIQRRRHLSEFAGQTLAVDAYVWLHRGAYACAAELVQRRPTRRYIDYCMARVRILRHHGIEPYLVFDGGPLPAKLGTEKEREKRREQNVRLANELMAQGRESQAAECYAKCVDVTPQMAYQVIKALKVEKVRYVVAPYEADAQLAYLERTGIVDGIITEDSDLLVFGCRNVHVKLDVVAATVISISRTDFGSPALAASSFSLIGWSEAQFRWMAMLSGCDYLPSINGVGLKTAYHMLKKYKAVDKAVKMIRLEGRKSVPKDYLDSFYLAEKVFLHQRVYDPRVKRLVYLANPSDESCLDEAAEMYIGRDLDPSLATRIAVGDVCPISLSEMEDIYPSFVPRPIESANRRPLQDRDMNSTGSLKGQTPSKKGGILSFFSPVARLSSAKIPSPAKGKSGHPRIVAGNASGKRTLLDVMEQDIASKRKKVSAENESECQSKSIATSHFFAKPTSSHEDPLEKENVDPVTDAEVEIVDDPVTQEDGYLSPSPSLSRAETPNVSSPVVAYKQILQTGTGAIEGRQSQDVPARESIEQIFVRGSSEPLPECDENHIPGPDLAINLTNDGVDDDQDADRLSQPSSEIVCWEDDDAVKGEISDCLHEGSLTPPPSTQKESPTDSIMTRNNSFVDTMDDLELLEIDEGWERQRNDVQARLAEKWRRAYSLGSRLTGSANTSVELSHHDAVNVKCSHSRPSRTASDSAIKHVSRNDGVRVNPHPSLVELGTTGRNMRTPDTPSPKLGSRMTPILIDLNEVSDEVACHSRAKLQGFRFSG